MVAESGYTRYHTSVNTIDGRVLDPVYVGQFPQMSTFQPSVTHRDFNVLPFLCDSSHHVGSKNLDSFRMYSSGRWQEKGYVPSYIYGGYGESPCATHRFLTSYTASYPDEAMGRRYPPEIRLPSRLQRQNPWNLGC